DRRAGEADDGVDAERAGGPGGVLHLLGGPPADAFGLAVAPDAGGQDALVALVDGVVADGLADQVVGDRPHAAVVLGQGLLLAFDVGVVRDGLVDLEVIAPAGDLQAVVAPFGRQPADLLERQVRPLPGEQRDRSRHDPPQSSSGCLSRALLGGRRHAPHPQAVLEGRGGGSAPAAVASRKSFVSWTKAYLYPRP